MARRPPDRTVLEEIRKLRANLTSSQFQPLHTGLGIGRVRPVMAKHPTPTPSPSPSPVQENRVADRLPPLPADVMRPPQAPPSIAATPMPKARKIQAPKNRFQGFLKRASMWGIDALVVGMTLLVGMMALELYAGAGPSALLIKNLPRTLPFMVVRELGPLRTLVGLAIVLVLYWLFFRVFAGGTLGEYVVGRRGARKTEKA